MNSFDEKTQDTLTGRPGSFKIIRSAFANLKEAGYPSKSAVLAVSTIICKQNIDDLPKMWRWLRDQEIVPYFEMITPQGNANSNQWLEVEPERLHALFSEVCAIDRNEYGLAWDPQPPLLGHRCMRHLFSCLVSSRGDVFPCVGVTIPIGTQIKNRHK